MTQTTERELIDALKRMDSPGPNCHVFSDGTPVVRAAIQHIVALQSQLAAAREVKELVWELIAPDVYAAKDFRVVRLDQPRREIWRLLQADFGTQYRGDFGGKDGKGRAMEVAATIDARRIHAALKGGEG